jgi:acrylyl-CoA reductase (NADPH)
MSEVRAFVAGSSADGYSRRIEHWSTDAFGDDVVDIRVEWSCINFKDGLATSENGKVARLDPLVPGVDLAGTVVASRDAGVTIGQQVIVHGYDLGVAHHGGYAELARVPAEWIVPMPDGLDARTAMLVGTAGYTAALSVEALERQGLQPGDGPVLVTGATGGVGSMAVGMLAARGYEVVASTGKVDEGEWLHTLGATSVIDRRDLTPEQPRPLDKERWAGAVDCVGGPTLAHVLRTMRAGGSVAASGLTGGAGLPTTVHPFILRGVNLLGIESVWTPIDTRRRVWERIATDLRPAWLSTLDAEVVGLDDLPPQLDRILAGGMRGRVLVDPTH